jgi:RNA polymerase sigma factor (sigma-70 family)
MTDPRTNHTKAEPDDDKLEDAYGLENISTSDMVAGWKRDVSLQDRKLAVQRAIQTLPVDQRRLMILRFFEEGTFEDCAEAMGISVTTCRALYRTACERLKRALDSAMGLDKKTRT